MRNYKQMLQLILTAFRLDYNQGFIIGYISEELALPMLTGLGPKVVTDHK